MTVRWKPLLILSGLFVVVAIAGLMTIATVMGSRKSSDFVARARAERQAKEFEKAKLDYQIALKSDNRNADLHQELADLYKDWMQSATADRKGDLRDLYKAELTTAANLATKRIEPRRALLAEAMLRDDHHEESRWATQLAEVDPTNADAAYVIVAEKLDAAAPNLADARRALKVLEGEKPARVRTDWVAARIAEESKDQAQLAAILDRVRPIVLAPDATPADRVALLNLRKMDLGATTDVTLLADRVEAFKRDALAATNESEIPSTRIARISLLIMKVQKILILRGVEQPASREVVNAYGNSLDEAAEAIFQKSLAVKTKPDLNVFLAYAEYLRFRDRRDRCLEVVEQGLNAPAAAKQGGSESGLGLHALAVEAYLGSMNQQAAERHEKAASHIKSLLESKLESYQALGHLFQGAIDLERAGLTDAKADGLAKDDRSKLRASALIHLRTAATQLPASAEAQARYGVALILNQEPSLGRQYLQLAQRIGGLEPQYQIWTAWSVVHAGYPEEAEPIVARMLEAVEQGRLPRNFEGTLHLLSGEIHQARKSPGDLNKAIEEYRKAFANGEDATPAVELRLAQIEVMRGESANALKRIDWLASKGKAGPAAENLAVLTLTQMKRDDEAKQRLAAARAAYPDSGELATLEASILVKAKQVDRAERTLADFMEKYPDNVAAAQLRAQILANDLKRPADARKLLAGIVDRAENSAPMVQLALLELNGKDFESAATTVGRIRRRWKDASTADLLDAQLALAKNDIAAASTYFDAALKKDPQNKVVQFYKATIDGRSDPEGASKVFESLAHENSVKEVDAGLSIVKASQSALASIALESGDLDQAIARYREMLKDGNTAEVARSIRWQIVAALAAKKEWPAARAEITALLGDIKNPPTAEERIRAATYFRLNKEDAAALTQADAVLKADPTYPGAVVTRAEILSRTSKHAEAIATIRRSIDSAASKGEKAPSVLYLMMAAVESVCPPKETGFERALVALDAGLALDADNIDLVKAKCKVLILTRGAKAGAEFVATRAKANPEGPYRQMLLTIYSDQHDYAAAGRVAAELLKENPKDAATAATQVQLVAAEVAEATGKGDAVEARRLNDRAAALIAEHRNRFKDDLTFLQLDCELAIRQGDLNHALALTQEVDAKAKAAPVGPLLRAQVFTIKGQTVEAAAAYAEALARNPRQPEARLQLARLSLQNDQFDEAIRQARYLMDADPDKPIGLAALAVEARAMAARKETASQVQANRAKAIERLAAALRDHPEFVEAALLIAEIQVTNGDRPRAVATLKDALKANPNDPNALAMAIQVLTEPRGKGQPAPKADVEEAKALAKQCGDGDTKGDRLAAIAAGFSRAGQPELALPWAERAANTAKTAASRLSLGDLLLTMSEAQTDQARARKLLDRALVEYDAILAAQPNLVDAVNNKAWILHSYLKRSQDALALAQGLVGRVDPSSLPGEFYDTLGSIQEELGQKAEAEKSYQLGLSKTPEHPVLNFHMGQLMLADKAKARKALEYLKVAQAGSDRLPAALADKLNLLLLQVPAN